MQPNPSATKRAAMNALAYKLLGVTDYDDAGFYRTEIEDGNEMERHYGPPTRDRNTVWLLIGKLSTEGMTGWNHLPETKPQIFKFVDLLRRLESFRDWRFEHGIPDEYLMSWLCLVEPVQILEAALRVLAPGEWGEIERESP